METSGVAIEMRMNAKRQTKVIDGEEWVRLKDFQAFAEMLRPLMDKTKMEEMLKALEEVMGE